VVQVRKAASTGLKHACDVADLPDDTWGGAKGCHPFLGEGTMRQTICIYFVVLAAHNCRASTPVVFIPGTGGSSLRFAKTNELYWLDEQILKRRHLLRGSLGGALDEELAAGQAIDLVVPRRGKSLQKKLSVWARDLRIPGTECLLERLPQGIPVYSSFFKWARKDFAPRAFLRLLMTGGGNLRITWIRLTK